MRGNKLKHYKKSKEREKKLITKQYLEFNPVFMKEKYTYSNQTYIHPHRSLEELQTERSTVVTNGDGIMGSA